MLLSLVQYRKTDPFVLNSVFSLYGVPEKILSEAIVSDAVKREKNISYAANCNKIIYSLYISRGEFYLEMLPSCKDVNIEPMLFIIKNEGKNIDVQRAYSARLYDPQLLASKSEDF